MTKKWLSYVFMLLLAALVLWLPQAKQTEASSDGYIYWGEEQSAEYSPLHPYTLNWSGDVLDRGGMNLTTLQQTASSNEADIVINQYGALGARSVVKLSSSNMQERTSIYQQGALNSITMKQGDVYLITLSNGKYAKLRIDQIRTDKVLFSFVLEGDPPQSTEAPRATAPENAPGSGNGTGLGRDKNEEHGDQSTPAPTIAPNNAAGGAGGASAGSTTGAASSKSNSSAQGQSVEEIKLTIGKKSATMNGSNKQLQSAPIVKNGVTLVPLRFIAESIGAEVNWDKREQKITLVLNEKTIILHVNSKVATINGVRTTLLTEPIVVGGTTLVPIRFISENFDMKVSYNAATGSITINGKGAVNGSNQAGSNSSGANESKRSVTPNSIFGAWKLTGYYDREAGGVAISEDGTYAHRVMYEGTKRGKWRYAEPGEVPELEEAIILQYGADNTDWAVGFDDEGAFVMYYRYMKSAGGLYGGREYGWFHDTTGTKYSDRAEDVMQIRISTIEYDYTKYYGSWSLWIEGGAINIYNPGTGEYVAHRYSPGADGGTLTINANGTYTLKTYAVTQSGTWRAADYNEVFGYNGGIILEASGGQEVWAMYGTPSGKIALAQDSGSTYTDGSKIWIIQFILEK